MTIQMLKDLEERDSTCYQITTDPKGQMNRILIFQDRILKHKAILDTENNQINTTVDVFIGLSIVCYFLGVLVGRSFNFRSSQEREVI